jgi:hypothetical protein
VSIKLIKKKVDKYEGERVGVRENIRIRLHNHLLVFILLKIELLAYTFDSLKKKHSFFNTGGGVGFTKRNLIFVLSID